MSTVIPNKAKDSEDATSGHAAPKHVLKSTYDLVLTALNGNKKVILITGGGKKGKTTLLHTISKDIAATNRVINLSGKDLPALDKSENNVTNPELSNMKDFILESTDLDDTLVVTLDDADQLPINFIGELATNAKNSASSGHSIQLLLSAPSSYKQQLLSMDGFGTEDITHFSLDSFSEEDIHAYAKNKTYKISSNIKRLEFKPDSLQALSDFIQADQQLLDVVLEWCAAIAKKDQLTSITSHTVNRAAGFAKQFSKDKNLRLANSYPPSHEVYKYINGLQSAKKSSTKVKKKSVKKLTKNKANKPFIQTTHKVEDQIQPQAQPVATKIPTITSTLVITSKIEPDKQAKSVVTKPTPDATADKEVLQSLKEIEDGIMPAQWTKPPRQQNASQNKSFPAIVGLLSLVVVGFIAFITYRVGSTPNVAPVNEAPAKEQVAQQDVIDEVPEVAASAPKLETEPKPLQEAVIENTKAVVVTKPNTDGKADSNNAITDAPANTESNSEAGTKTNTEKVKQIVTQNEKAETVVTPHAGIIASDTKNETIAKTPTEKTELGNKVTDPKIATPKLAVKQPANKAGNKPVEKQPPKAEEANKDALASKTEISGLLALAEYQFENKKMSTPVGDNSLETYQKILTKYPNNKSAVAGIQKIHDKYVDWGHHYLRQNEVNRAKNFFTKALAIDPNDAVSKTNLQNIAKQETSEPASVDASNSVALQDAIPPRVIQSLLSTANEKMRQIGNDIGANKRNYKVYQEAQSAYQGVLENQPQNQQAIQGLSFLKMYYADWAELQIKSRNYNIALFLYGQALSIEPGNTKINQRIEQIRQLKSAGL